MLLKRFAERKGRRSETRGSVVLRIEGGKVVQSDVAEEQQYEFDEFLAATSDT